MIELNPHVVESYINRGITYSKKHQFDKAIADHNTVIQLQPNHISGFVNRGFTFAIKGDFDNAIADFTRAIQLNPLCQELYYNRGKVYSNQNNIDMSLADFNTAIQLNPDDAIAYYSRAKVWMNKKEWTKARSDLTAADDKGIDIAAIFSNEYRSIEKLEKQFGVKLPDDIAAMLAQQEHETQSEPKEMNLFADLGNIDHRSSKETLRNLTRQKSQTQSQSMPLRPPQSASGIEQPIYTQ